MRNKKIIFKLPARFRIIKRFFFNSGLHATVKPTLNQMLLDFDLFDGDGRTPVFLFVQKRKANGTGWVDVRVEEWRDKLDFLQQ